MLRSCCPERVRGRPVPRRVNGRRVDPREAPRTGTRRSGPEHGRSAVRPENSTPLACSAHRRLLESTHWVSAAIVSRKSRGSPAPKRIRRSLPSPLIAPVHSLERSLRNVSRTADAFSDVIGGPSRNGIFAAGVLGATGIMISPITPWVVPVAVISALLLTVSTAILVQRMMRQ